MATYGGETSFTIGANPDGSYAHFNGYVYNVASSGNTATSKKFIPTSSGTTYSNRFIILEYTNSTNVCNVDQTNASADPYTCLNITTNSSGTAAATCTYVSGDTIQIFESGGSGIGTFTINNNMVWTVSGGSGSGTGNSGGVGFTGSFYDVANYYFTWEVTHTSAFTSPQTYELHSTTLTPTFISDLVVGAASGSSNSRTHTWGTPDVIQIRDAYGTVAGELTLAHASNSQKKVFCNFW